MIFLLNLSCSLSSPPPPVPAPGSPPQVSSAPLNSPVDDKSPTISSLAWCVQILDMAKTHLEETQKTRAELSRAFSSLWCNQGKLAVIKIMILKLEEIINSLPVTQTQVFSEADLNEEQCSQIVHTVKKVIAEYHQEVKPHITPPSLYVRDKYKQISICAQEVHSKESKWLEGLTFFIPPSLK